jgi:hypothetical protein
MSHFTSKQRRALVNLAHGYAPAVRAIVSSRGSAPVDARSTAVAVLFDEFASKVIAILLQGPEHADVSGPKP